MLCEVGRITSGSAMTKRNRAMSAGRKTFKDDQSGNMGMVFALCLLPTVGFVGMATDVGRSFSIRSQINATLDACVVAGGRAFDLTADKEKAAKVARDCFQKYLPKGLSASISKINVDNKGNVNMAAASDMKPIFLPAVGVNTIKVTSFAQSLAPDAVPGEAGGGKNLEIALVMDVTGSMKDNSKLATAKLAANDLLDILMPTLAPGAPASKRSVRISIVPFSEYVNAGAFAPAATGVSSSAVSTYACTQSQTVCTPTAATCQSWSGFDNTGFDKNGYDKHGFDHNGFDHNSSGQSLGGGDNEDDNNQTPYDKHGYDSLGYDKNGWDHHGCDHRGTYHGHSNGGDGEGDDHGDHGDHGNNNNNNNDSNHDTRDHEVYNASGIDQHGFDHDGYDSSGFDHNGFDHDGYDHNGKDVHGRDHDGFDSQGRDVQGFDHDGYDKNGFDKNGCDHAGKDKYGNVTATGVHPHSAGQTCSSYRSSACTTQNVATTCSRTTYLNTCMAERMSSTGHDSDDAAPGTGSYFHAFTTTDVNGTNCAAPSVALTPLTNNKANLQAAIAALQPAGGTAGHIGTAWGWYTVSANWTNFWPAASAPAAADPAKLLKVVIIMTDGDYNTHYDTNYSQIYEDYSNNPAVANGRSRDQALALCSNMKTAGVEVFTVGVELSNNTAKTVLQNCASSPTTTSNIHYYDVSAATNQVSGLEAAFKNIATKIGTITGTGNRALVVNK